MTIDVDGTRIGFEDRGTGTAVVFLHAFPLSAAMWAAQETALGGRFRVVRVDARGFGSSEQGTVPLSMDVLAGDAAAVMDHLGIDRAVVLGCSMGGYAALAFARLFAARLRGLVLVDTKAAPDSDEARAGRATLARAVQERGAIAVAEAMLPKLVGATTHRERPQVVEAVRAAIVAAAPRAIVGALQAMAARPDSRPLLPSVVAPTLVIRGEEDAIITEDDARLLHEGIRGSRLRTLAGTGHLPSLETEGPFNEALASFVDAL